MDDSRDALNDIDRMLATALDVRPSADFEARVRQRIANEPVRAPFWRGWRIVLPAAAAAVVVVAAGIALRSHVASPVPQALTARVIRLGEMRPTDVRPAAVRPAPAVVAAPRSVPSVGSSVAPATVVAQREPEVLVPREEIDMYRRLIAQAQNVPGALLVVAPPDIVAVRSISDIPIDPIRIDLIIPSVDGEGDRQ